MADERLTVEGLAAAAASATRLADVADEVAARHHGRLVKLLGDGVMLHCPLPSDAARAALALRGAMAPAGLPPAHIGIHAGAVIRRESDYFGRTVNVAARLGALAGLDEILVSAELADLVDALPPPEPMGSRTLKGIAEPGRCSVSAPGGSSGPIGPKGPGGRGRGAAGCGGRNQRRRRGSRRRRQWSQVALARESRAAGRPRRRSACPFVACGATRAERAQRAPRRASEAPDQRRGRTEAQRASGRARRSHAQRAKGLSRELPGSAPFPRE